MINGWKMDGEWCIQYLQCICMIGEIGQTCSDPIFMEESADAPPPTAVATAKAAPAKAEV